MDGYACCDALCALGGERVDWGGIGWISVYLLETAGGAQVVQADEAIVAAGEECVASV